MREIHAVALRRGLVLVGGVLLAGTVFFAEPESARDLAVGVLGLALLLAGLYSAKRAEDADRERRRTALRDVGGPADVAPEGERLPRREPFDEG